MTRSFEKRNPWERGLALGVLLALVVLAPVSFSALRHIYLENDVENWLPDGDRQATVLGWYQQHFASEDRVLATWDGSSLNDPRVGTFAEMLQRGGDEDGGTNRPGPSYVSHVITPQDVIARKVESDIEPEEAARRLEGVLIGTGGLKVRLTDAGRARREQAARALVDLAQRELGLQTRIEASVREQGQEDREPEHGEGDAAREIVYPPLPRHDLQIRWRAMRPDSEETARFVALAEELQADEAGGGPLVERLFFAPGSPVAVVIILSEAGADDRPGAVEFIRQAARAAGISDEEFRLAGSPVVETALNLEAGKTLWNPDVPPLQFHKCSPMLLSLIVGAGMALVMLQSVRLAAMVLSITLLTILFSASLVPATGGSMNIVLVVMPTLLMVLTLSGAIHVVNYWKHAVHRDPQTAVMEAGRMAWQPCALASVTTAIGLASLVVSTLTPVRHFGLYSAVGCLIALAMILLALPALLHFWSPKAPGRQQVNRAAWRRWGTMLARHQWLVSTGCLTAFAVSAYGLNWFQTETKAIRYFPDDARIVQDSNYVEDILANIIPVETIVRFDQQAQEELNFFDRTELVRKIQNRIGDHPEISGTVSFANFRPVSERPPEEARFLEKGRYERSARIAEDRVRTDHQDEARPFLVVPDRASEVADLDRRPLNGAGDELWRITAQVAIMSDLDYGDLTDDLNAVVQAELQGYSGVGHVVTGMVPLFLRTQQAVLESLIRSFALAAVVIAVVLMIVLRNPLAGLLTMLPNLLPVGLVFGLFSWFGQAVDIGTMITASVALGIAVDGTLHLLTWFRKGLAEGHSRAEAVSLALGHCGPAMWQTSTVVGLGLLMLAPHDLLLVSRFGWLMASLVGAALVADVIFLPALLAGPLGRLIERTVATTAEEPQPVQIAFAEPEMSSAELGAQSAER